MDGYVDVFGKYQHCVVNSLVRQLVTVSDGDDNKSWCIGSVGYGQTRQERSTAAAVPGPPRRFTCYWINTLTIKLSPADCAVFCGSVPLHRNVAVSTRISQLSVNFRSPRESVGLTKLQRFSRFVFVRIPQSDWIVLLGSAIDDYTSTRSILLSRRSR